MRRNPGFLLLLAAAAFSLCSCAHNPSPNPPDKDPNVSTIPWDHGDASENGSGVPGANLINSR